MTRPRMFKFKRGDHVILDGEEKRVVDRFFSIIAKGEIKNFPVYLLADLADGRDHKDIERV